jgi:putative ABC transport system permease protein
VSDLRQLPQRKRIRYSGVLWLYIVRLRQRWPQELLAVIGITVGVALLFASQIASTSLSGPVRQLTKGIVGNSELQLVARSPAGFPQSTYDAVRELPGVRNAAPILQAQANLVGPKGSRGVTVFGADPRVVRLRGTLLQGFTAPDVAQQRAVVVPKPIARAVGVRFGDKPLLQLNGRTVAVPIGTVDRDDIGALSNTSLVLAPLKYMQSLTGLHGRLSRILVEVEPGQRATARAGLRRVAAGRLNVVSADHEFQLFKAASAPTSQATTIFSLLSALVGFLFAFCAMLVTAADRRALAIGLRMSGYRPWQVTRMILVDAVALGVVSVVAGLILGDALSRHGFGSDIGFLGGAFPVGEERIVSWSSVVIAAAGGMLAAALGVLTPLRGSIFTRNPRRELTDSPRPRRHARTVLGAAGTICLAAAVALTVAIPDAVIVGLGVLALSLALLLPLILDGATGVLLWGSRRTSRGWIPAVELALRQLRSPEWRVRSLAITMTGAIAVFGSVSLQGSRGNLQAGLDRVAVGLNSAADVWVSPFGAGDMLATQPFEPSRTERLSRPSAVRSVGLFRGGFLDVADRRIMVMAPPKTTERPIPSGQILDGDERRASTQIRRGGWATVSRALADQLGVRVGDRFTLPSPVPTVFRVAAITTNLGWPTGAVVINADDHARGWGSDAATAYVIRLAPGVPPDLGRAEVTRALGRNTALRVEPASERIERQRASARSGLLRLSQIASLTLVAAVLAMAAAIAGLLWQHRRTVARQKLDGHKTPRMWSALFIEAATLVVTGCLAGAAFALLGQVLCTRGVAAVTGFPVVDGIRFDVVVWSVLAVVLTSLVVVALPGYLVARVRPSLRE